MRNSHLKDSDGALLAALAERMQSLGWHTQATADGLHLVRDVCSRSQRVELRRTAVGRWDVYQCVFPASRPRALPAVPLLNLASPVGADWEHAVHALDAALEEQLLSS